MKGGYKVVLLYSAKYLRGCTFLLKQCAVHNLWGLRYAFIVQVDTIGHLKCLIQSKSG